MVQFCRMQVVQYVHVLSRERESRKEHEEREGRL